MAASTKHVVALTRFYDVKAGVNRAMGEEFDVTDSRFKELNACGVEQGGVPLVAVKEPSRSRKAAE